MKIIELEIKDIRGIRHLNLTPDEKNFVIWGPNGSGKSAVVDALDFLLTGNISRLTGEGTSGISLNKFGPHIDSTPQNATVKAKIKIQGLSNPVKIKRSMDNSDELICNDSIKPKLEPIITLSKRGQHVLSRKEILKYITATAGDRAKQIQELLNISEIEKIRKSIKKAVNGLKKEKKAAEKSLKSAQKAINFTAQLKRFDSKAVLEIINKNRSILGGKPIKQLIHSELQKDVSAPKVLSDSKGVNTTFFQRYIDSLKKVNSDQYLTNLAKIYSTLQENISSINSNPVLLRNIHKSKLIELGLDLIDETGNCPLCDTDWEKEALDVYLKGKLSKIQKVVNQKNNIEKALDEFITLITNNTNNLNNIIPVITKIKELEKENTILKDWLTELLKLQKIIEKTKEKFSNIELNSDEIQKIMSPDKTGEILDKTLKIVQEKFPKSTPEQNAWDTLTKLGENLKAYEQAERGSKNANLSFIRAEILYNTFIQARDTVLGKLYKDIEDKFVNLYCELHKEDEKEFKACIEPDDAGLNIQVDFHGRGNYPPHALHSEGHQDSMGLCLYLVLAEKLNKGLIDIVILDDVVMSVDSGHRKELCRVLKKSFPQKQFLITTHDKSWASQLRYEGVVKKENLIEFYNWNIDDGPSVNHIVDIWEKIDEDLNKNDVPAASAKLRRFLEQFFDNVCDAIEVKTTHKSHRGWSLGELLPPAVGQYRKLLRSAKNVAQSWKNQKKLEEFNELDSILTQINKRTGIEQWAVNVNVHYNSWTDFSKEDFIPVVEAFQDLCNQFICTNCGGTIYITKRGNSRESVRCNCGEINWNLVKKKN